MSKYTRLNKINHYHDSGPLSQTTTTTPILESRIRPPLNYNGQEEEEEANLSMITMMRKKRNGTNNKSKLTLSDQLLNSKQLTKTTTTTTMNYNLKLAFIAFISILLVLLVSLNGVHSLNCYHCSSVDDPGCDEAFTGRANYTDLDCSKHLKQDQIAKVCRKIVQYIEHKKVVIRSCGHIDEHEEKDRKPMCYKRSGTFAIMMESCNCYEDNCNHSASLVPANGNYLLLLAASCSLLFYLTTNIITSTSGCKTLRR